MTSLFDVGKSAIQAYRQSLAVTGQNIANMNTEGYMRREADLQEVTASQGGITSIADQSGLGVRVADIRRSFDAFLLDRARSSTANFERMDGYVDQLRQLQDFLLPSDADLGSQIGRFFEALGDVGSAPGDLAPRVVALEEGQALAANFRSTANILEQQKTGTLSLLKDAFSALSLLAEELASINGRILSAGQSGQSPNSLLDLRDRVITDISKLTDVTVSYEDRGVANVTLGSSGVGPSLVAKTEATKVGFIERAGGIQVVLKPGVSNAPTSQVTSGMVSGLSDAYALISEVQKEVDHLAVLISSALNKQHKSGLDLDGNTGREMFSANGLMFEANPANGSVLSVEIDIKDVLAIPTEMMTAVYSDVDQRWTVTGEGLEKPLTGTNMISGPGFVVRIDGKPKGGDSFSIVPQGNAAAAIEFLLKRPQEFAAASSNIVAADVKNLGSAELSVQTGVEVEAALSRPISEVMLNSQSPVEATEFLRNGLVASIPAGTSDISVASFGLQASAKFQFSTSELASVSQFRFELDGSSNDGPHVFNISRIAAYPKDMSGGTWEDAADIALLLNNGVLRSTAGYSLKDLGMHASGADNSLTVASASANFLRTGPDVAQILTSMGSSVAVLSDAVSASDIQIFTREGRHIAGSPLNNVEISALMNSENGFTKGALYNGAYLNQTNNAYRGMSLDVSYQGGLYAIDLGSNGSTAVAIGGNTTVPANTVRSQDFTVTMANGDRKDISMSAGISAGAAAAKLNEALSENGILAESNLRVELSSFSAAGEVKFDIESLNASPITIAATITPSNIEPLARAINNETANTGVSAVLSANGKRLILESKGGEDIIFSSVGSASPEFSSKILGTDGSAVTAPLVIGSNGSNGRINTARFSGILTVSAGDAFSIDAGNGVVNAVKDPLRGGFVSVSGNATGDTKRIAFEVNPDSSGSAAALDGLKAVAASGSFSLGLPTIDSAIRFDANISASSLTDLSTTAVNKAVVEAIREQGPLSSLTGSPTSPLPAEGASVTVSFAGDLYKLTMADGDVLVSGGEPGRVTAYFDASGRLQLFGGGTIAGQQVVVVDDSVVGNNLNAASQFGIATPTSRLTGREFTLAAGLPTLSVMFNGSQVSIAIAADGTISKTPAVAGLSARWQESSSGRGRIILEVSSAVDQMQVTRPTNSLGFKTADVSLRLTDGIIQAKSLTGDVVAIEADARGIAGQTITMSNMPHEDLLVIVTGGGARSIGAVYGEVLAAPERSQISVEVSDENGTVIEILDSETGHSIATRLLDQNGFANFGDYQLELRGLAKKGDKFSIGQNLNATGDGRNMNLLLNLQTADANGTNSGGFQQVFNTIVASVGAAVRSGDISLEAATAQRDAAAEAESEFSGVNLDSEAAALMEFQQAYQASARILSTARELFQSLMDVV